jgi:bacteriocin-like protein
MSDEQKKQLTNDELAKVAGGRGSAYDGALSCELVPDDETFLKYFNGKPKMCMHYEYGTYPGITYMCGSCKHLNKS